MKIIQRLTLALLSALVFACANQQPPGGGDADYEPPKIERLIPEDGTINYEGTSVRIKFDEYVDKRSFRDALFISPKPKGNLSFNWSGREVEIEFQEKLKMNTTYKFTIGRDFKDIRSGNSLREPISFAFSTGQKIDKAAIIGKIYDYSYTADIIEKYQKVIVLGYKLGKDVNPEKTEPDYITQSDNNGMFKLSNLPAGNFRLFCVNDKDKNYLYDKDFDDIGILNRDIALTDTSIFKDANFLMNLSQDYKNKVLYPYLNRNEKIPGLNYKMFDKFAAELNTDSNKVIYTSLKENEQDISVNNNIYMYFKNSDYNKLDVMGGISITDTLRDNKYPVSFLWVTDSLLEISPVNLLPYSSFFVLNTGLLHYGRYIERTVRFKTSDERKYAKVKINYANLSDSVSQSFVFVINSENYTRSSYFSVDGSGYTGEIKISEGAYWIFSFLDSNGDRYFNEGKHYPFEPSEKFFISEQPFSFKYLWEGNNNININF